MYKQYTRVIDMKKLIFTIVPMIAILLAAMPMALASNESNSQRSHDGFNDGTNAARTDVTFNPACDPQGLHTSDGQHSSTYCNAWSNGYTTTWNSIHQTDQTQTQTLQSKQTQSGTCIALVCKQIQSGTQGANQGQSSQP
jgi:hypothetical protein